jgi:hypothetical protein
MREIKRGEDDEHLGDLGIDGRSKSIASKMAKTTLFFGVDYGDDDDDDDDDGCGGGGGGGGGCGGGMVVVVVVGVVDWLLW